MNNKTPFLTRIKQTGLTASLVKGTTLALNKVAPNWTYKKVEDLLLTPKSKKISKTNIPHGINLIDIDTPQGNLQGYLLGQGPTVLLVHGWSGGAHQFFPLMRGLSQCGFQVLAFDHFGHGHSDGKHASLQLFTSAINSVLNYVYKNAEDGFAAVVGHSTGCIAMANAQVKLIKDIPLLCISPVFNYKKYFHKQIGLLGLHNNLSKQYLSRFEADYLSGLQEMELSKKLGDYSENTLIIHDKMDEESDYLDSIKFCSANPLTKLNVTRGFGHIRIINSESVWQQLKSHLNYEDITVNPFT